MSRGRSFVKTARLKMSGEAALLHQGGTKTGMCAFNADAARQNGRKQRQPTTRHLPEPEAEP
eukprot:6099377-Prymnesium_polylepis.1